jgi:hypothetical protein
MNTKCVGTQYIHCVDSSIQKTEQESKQNAEQKLHLLTHF